MGEMASCSISIRTLSSSSSMHEMMSCIQLGTEDGDEEIGPQGRSTTEEELMAQSRAEMQQCF